MRLQIETLIAYCMVLPGVPTWTQDEWQREIDGLWEAYPAFMRGWEEAVWACVTQSTESRRPRPAAPRQWCNGRGDVFLGRA